MFVCTRAIEMLPQKQAKEAIVSSYNATEHDGREEEEKEDSSGFNMKSLLWHGGSVYDAWFSCASNQVSKKSTVFLSETSWFLIFSSFGLFGCRLRRCC